MERAERAKVSLLRYLGCVPFSQTFFPDIGNPEGCIVVVGRTKILNKIDPYGSWLQH